MFLHQIMVFTVISALCSGWMFWSFIRSYDSTLTGPSKWVTLFRYTVKWVQEEMGELYSMVWGGMAAAWDRNIGTIYWPLHSADCHYNAIPPFCLLQLWLAKHQNNPTQDIYFYLCITAAFTCANSIVTLKMNAVRSTETSRYLTTTQFRNTNNGQHPIYNDHKNLNTDITPVQSNNWTSKICSHIWKHTTSTTGLKKFQNTCNNKGIQLKGKVRQGMYVKFHNRMERAAVGTARHHHVLAACTVYGDTTVYSCRQSKSSAWVRRACTVYGDTNVCGCRHSKSSECDRCRYCVRRHYCVQL